MRRILQAMVVVAVLAADSPARAFLIVPGEEAAGSYIVVIEGDLGDHVPLKALPPPHNALPVQTAPEQRLWFWWTYFRSTEEGRASFSFDERGSARFVFEFAGPDLSDGDTLGAAAVLVDGEGRALHSLLARAKVEGSAFAGGGATHRISLDLDRDAAWWGRVAGYTFLNMKYYRIQELDEAGVRRAMLRALERVRKGEGAVQWD